MIKFKKIKPLFTNVVTTMDRYTKDDCNSALLDAKMILNKIKEVQKVVSVGNDVRNVKVGDLVYIDFSRYMHPKNKRDTNTIKSDIESYHIEMVCSVPTVTINGEEHLFIEDRDVSFIIEEWEEETTPSPLIKPQTIIHS